MNDRKEHIDDLLHRNLSDASLDAPGIGWDAFAVKKDKRKRRALLWWSSAMVAAFIVLFLWKNMPVTQSNESVTKQLETTSGNTASETVADKKSGPGSTAHTDRITSGMTAEAGARYNGLVVKDMALLEQVPSKEEFLAEESVQTSEEALEMAPIITPEEILLEPEKLEESAEIEPEKKITVNDKDDVQWNKKGLFWQIQMGASLNMPHFQVTEAGKQFIHKNYESIRQQSERGLWGYGFQASVGKQFEKFSVGLGLGFSILEIGAVYDFSYSEKPIRDVDGRIIGYNQSNTEQVTYNDKHKYAFVDLPLTVQYHLVKKGDNIVSLHLGWLNQFANQLSGDLPNAVVLDQKDNLRTENFKSWTPSVDLGLEWRCRISDKNDIVITPRYRRNLGFSQVQSLYKTNFNNVGLGISFRRTL